MCPYNEMTKAISGKYHDKIKKSCSKLFECFNLQQFYYCKIYNDGTFYNLDSDVHATEVVCAKRLHLNFPYFSHPETLENGTGLIKDVDCPDLKECVDAYAKLNYHLWFRSARKTLDGFEEFGFHSNSSNELQYSIFLNEQPSLHLFFDWFRKENKNLFSSAEDQKINIAELIGPKFFKKGIQSFDCNKRDDFLRSLGIDIPQLSRREKEVLDQLLNGGSARFTASTLNLSRRTVEHHIERIKDKFGCNTKDELIKKSRHLGLNTL